ncbi:MAG: tRNA-dihydrouridine synthase, partial [Bacteroidetes bacterium]|nr:tRNA-dihydrouridine synthase [Bacteroidota bacterium]
MYKIGNVKIKNQLVLAPMADVNDIAFRILCKRAGAGLICNEMVNAHAVVRGNKNTLKMLEFAEEEKPI